MIDPATTLILRGNFNRPGGFTLINYRLQRGLQERGFIVTPVPIDGALHTPLPALSAEIYLFHGDPYDFLPAPARLNACFLHWEYRRLPAAWVQELNRVCDLVIAPSHPSRELYTQSGIAVPQIVFPAAADHAEFNPNVCAWQAPTGKSFRFVHLGGAHARRGTDVLLTAYRQEFTARDDVALVLKAFHYTRHRPRLEQQLAAYTAADAPEVIYVDEEFDSVAGIFTAADVGVYPLRAECFGLPVLECIASGRRVIVTANTGLDEFCNDDNADFVRATVIENGDHTSLEPDPAHLRALMRAAYERGKPSRDEQEHTAASVSRFTWARSLDLVAAGLQAQLARGVVRPLPSPPHADRGEDVLPLSITPRTRHKRFPEDFRFLVVAPAFLEWDLGTYVKDLLGDRGLCVETFAYRGIGDRFAANVKLLERAAESRVDVIIGLKLGEMEGETLRLLRDRGAVVALWYVDCFDDTVPEQMAQLVPHANVFFTSAKGMLDKYAALSSTSVHWLVEGAYLPAFADVTLANAQKPLYASQVAFVGSLFHPTVKDASLALHRYRLLSRICERYALKIWGPQGDPTTRERWGARCPLIEWPSYHQELVKICRSAEIVLGLNTTNTVPLYFSNRVFLTLAAGGFHLTHYVPQLEEMFTNHEHVVWFHSDDECLELIEHYLARPLGRARIAAQGQAWVRQEYGMEKQVARMLSAIEAHCVR